MTKPIRPEDVDAARRLTVPDEVIEVFNHLIIANYRDGAARITQSQVVEGLMDEGLTRKEIFEGGWLDVEALFDGWLVEYNKPGYNDDYEAFFVFKRPRP